MLNGCHGDDRIEAERYELREGLRFHFAASRREFVQAVGGGLMIVVGAATVRGQRAEGRRGRGRRREDQPESLPQRFHIGADGVVTVMTSKVEVGQGSRTQLSQAAAEEFRLPIERIQLVMADTARCPDDGGTAGSRTTPATVPQVRRAAALAREILLDLASDKLGVDRAELTYDGGVFGHKESQKKITLAELAGDAELAARLARRPAHEAALANPDEWRALGKPAPKVDARGIVTGAHKYPSDVVRPNMAYGKVLRPPSLTATLKSVDVPKAEAIEGATVVRDGTFVGCVAPNAWLASQAVDALAAAATWSSTPHPSSDELFKHLKETARRSNDPRNGAEAGDDPVSALPTAARKIDVAYTIAYIQHAPMEPRAAVAEWSDGKLTVWTGTQQPSRVQGELCAAFRLPPNKVRVIVPDTGGGFGGKHTGEAAVEAARLAKAAERPVSLRWTREEEFTWAYFRPAGLIEVRAGLDDSGRLAAWEFDNYNSGESALATPYQVANQRTRFLSADSPLRQGSYRALASTANTFARESAMDELAELAGIDPLEFRTAHLGEGRLKNVLLAAAEKFDWAGRRPSRRTGRGVGLACGTEKGSFVAACAEVEMVDGRPVVREVCQAFECGAIQNPLNLRAQVEGAIVMGLGGALSEEIRFAEGVIANAQFSEYFVPRMSDVPKLDVVLVDRRDLPSVGAGETPIIAVAPAVANAVFNAAGIRSRSMPLLADRRG
jgi:isoquinoline 1-oxidoreductase